MGRTDSSSRHRDSQRRGRHDHASDEFEAPGIANVLRSRPSSGSESGSVKWYNVEKGYGFIIPDRGGKDVFVHVSAVQKAGLTSLGERQRVRFDRGTARSGVCAINLHVIA